MKKIILLMCLTTIGFAHDFVDCSVSYRKSDFVGFSDKANLRVNLKSLGGAEFFVGPAREQDDSSAKATVGEFTVDVSGRGGNLSIAVTHEETSKTMYSVLFQTVKNLDTNHGVTGLHYVHSPTTEGWMNIFCIAK